MNIKTSLSKKLYICRKLQEIIRFAEHSGLEDGEEIAYKIGYGLYCIEESVNMESSIRLVKGGVAQ